MHVLVLMRLSMILGIIATTGLCVAAAPDTPFRAGAAKLDITPEATAGLPLSGYGDRNMTGVHDPLHVRAMVLDDGVTQGAIIVAEIASIGGRMYESLVPRLSEATGIPQDRILLAATHTHSAPSGGSSEGGGSPELHAWTAKRDAAIIQVVQDAQRKLQPARIGFGAGNANVNMNRRARLANGGWWLGMNPDGPTDKTVAVVSVTNTQGHPIAILTNYAVHCTVMGPENLLITSDIGGATASFVEQHYGGDTVCLWTSGAGGDQRPLYSVEPGFDQGAANRIQPVAVQGQILGEETVRVTDAIEPADNTPLQALQSVVTCPGKKGAPGPRYREDLNYQFFDADPVDIRLSALMIGHIAVTGVSGEVLVRINERLKRESPFTQTLMITHCNGSSGYLCDDTAYDQVSYEIVTTRVKKGYAENAIVNGLVDMLDGM